MLLIEIKNKRGEFVAKIKIRNILGKDIESVVDIQISGWQTAYKGIISDKYLNSLNKDELILKRKNDYQQDGYIVAEINEEIVGFCRYVDNNSYTSNMEEIDCEIVALYVKPNFKYKGIGTKMFLYVVKEFKRKKKTKMIIWCLKDNEPSKKFYTKMGGEIIGEKIALIGDENYTEVGFLYNI